MIKLTFFGKQLLKASAFAQDISKKMILLTFINITLDLSKTRCLYCIWYALILLNTSCKCTRDTHEQSDPPRGGQKGSLSGGPGTHGGPGFRIVRFRMQSSSAQTTACGRDDVSFLFRAEI